MTDWQHILSRKALILVLLSEFRFVIQLADAIKNIDFPNANDDVRQGISRKDGFLKLTGNPIKITNSSGDFSKQFNLYVHFLHC